MLNLRIPSIIAFIAFLGIWIWFCPESVATVNFERNSAIVEGYTVKDYVSAIYLAEGGEKADYPFGIRSVKCSGFLECQRICENTVFNNIARWKKSGKKIDFLSFLANRYAPINSDNDIGTNKFWKRNVKYFLEREIK